MPGIGPNLPIAFGWLAFGVNLDLQLAVFLWRRLAALLLWFVIRRTRVGLEMRAVVDRDSLASLRGVNPTRTSAVAWILTMVLAGLGGVLIAPLFVLNDIIFTLVVLRVVCRRRVEPACARSPSRSPAASCSASSRTSSPATATTSSRRSLKLVPG